MNDCGIVRILDGTGSSEGVVGTEGNGKIIPEVVGIENGVGWNI